MDRLTYSVQIILFLTLFGALQQADCQLGVVYSPFVKQEDLPHFTKSYKVQDVKKMLSKIVDAQIPFVTTNSVGAPNERYKINSTRFKCTSDVHAAIAAAEINLERNKSTLSIYQGIQTTFPLQQLISEIEVGLEIAKVANRIYRGTVPAIVFPTKTTFNGINNMIETVQNVSKRVRAMKLKFGARISNCATTMPTNNNYTKKVQNAVVGLFDFIICPMHPYQYQYAEGSDKFLKEITTHISVVDKLIKEMTNGTQVILETGWASGYNQSNPNEGVFEQKRFLKDMGQWAKLGNRMVIIQEAFNSPWKRTINNELAYAPHLGILKLTGKMPTATAGKHCEMSVPSRMQSSVKSVMHYAVLVPYNFISSSSPSSTPVSQSRSVFTKAVVLRSTTIVNIP